MTAREYLEQVGKLNAEINQKLRLKEDLTEILTSKNQALNNVVVTRTPDPHSRDGMIARIADLDQEINELTDRFYDLKEEIAVMIHTLPESYYTVLKLRFLELKSLDATAKAMGYTKDNVVKLISKALEMVSIPETCEKSE